MRAKKKQTLFFALYSPRYLEGCIGRNLYVRSSALAAGRYLAARKLPRSSLGGRQTGARRARRGLCHQPAECRWRENSSALAGQGESPHRAQGNTRGHRSRSTASPPTSFRVDRIDPTPAGRQLRGRDDCFHPRLERTTPERRKARMGTAIRPPATPRRKRTRAGPSVRESCARDGAWTLVEARRAGWVAPTVATTGGGFPA